MLFRCCHILRIIAVSVATALAQIRPSSCARAGTRLTTFNGDARRTAAILNPTLSFLVREQREVVWMQVVRLLAVTFAIKLASLGTRLMPVSDGYFEQLRMLGIVKSVVSPLPTHCTCSACIDWHAAAAPSPNPALRSCFHPVCQDRLIRWLCLLSRRCSRYLCNSLFMAQCVDIQPTLHCQTPNTRQ